MKKKAMLLAAGLVAALLAGCGDSSSGNTVPASALANQADRAQPFGNEAILIGIATVEAATAAAAEELRQEAAEDGVDLPNPFDAAPGDGQSSWWGYTFQNADQTQWASVIAMAGGESITFEEDGGFGCPLSDWSVDSDQAARALPGPARDALASAELVFTVLFDLGGGPVWLFGGETPSGDVTFIVDARSGAFMPEPDFSLGCGGLPIGGGNDVVQVPESGEFTIAGSGPLGSYMPATFDIVGELHPLLEVQLISDPPLLPTTMSADLIDDSGQVHDGGAQLVLGPLFVYNVVLESNAVFAGTWTVDATASTDAPSIEVQWCAYGMSALGEPIACGEDGQDAAASAEAGGAARNAASTMLAGMGVVALTDNLIPLADQ